VVISGSRGSFLHFGAQAGADEATHFKLGLQIERKEYWHYTR